MGTIVDKKYAGKYRDKNKDWFDTFLDEQVKRVGYRTRTVKEKDDEGKVTTREEQIELKAKTLDLDALFILSEANGIDTAGMKAQRDRPNAPGRIRMTLGNSLRAKAKKQHFLLDASGKKHEADAAFKTAHPVEAPETAAKAA